MLRIGILTSVASLVIIGGLWDGQASAPTPCIAAGLTTVQLATSARQPARTVSFTADRAEATIRVQIVDDPTVADLTIADDGLPNTETCPIDDITRLVAISPTPALGEPVIHLSREAGADLRIYVASERITLRQAAALIVGVHGGHAAMVTASVPTPHHDSR